MSFHIICQSELQIVAKLTVKIQNNRPSKMPSHEFLSKKEKLPAKSVSLNNVLQLSYTGWSSCADSLVQTMTTNCMGGYIGYMLNTH